MKKIIITILTIINMTGYSQKIDYNNFNKDLATKVLAQTYLNFRDTIDCYNSRKKWSDKHPEVLQYPELNKPRWSDWLYKTITEPNCLILHRDNNFMPYHVDRSKWYVDNMGVIRKEYYKDCKNTPKEYVENSLINYSENVYSFYNINVTTYQELATEIIVGWDKSIRHSCIMRGLSYDFIAYERFGLKITSMFACCVLYNKESKLTKVCLNILN